MSLLSDLNESKQDNTNEYEKHYDEKMHKKILEVAPKTS
jgi:hypothetical protein